MQESTKRIGEAKMETRKYFEQVVFIKRGTSELSNLYSAPFKRITVSANNLYGFWVTAERRKMFAAVMRAVTTFSWIL